MTDIVKVDYARNKDEVLIYIWLNIRSKQQIKTRIICISADEALKIIDYKEKFELKDQQYYIIPRTINNFERTICTFLRLLFDMNLVNKEKYEEFCKERLDVYKKIYRNENRICKQFFANYFPDKNRAGYNTFNDLLENNLEQINCNLCYRNVKIGGEFVGCYYDNDDRLRPRTSRVEYLKQYDRIEQLWCALELSLEGKLKEVPKVENSKENNITE